MHSAFFVDLFVWKLYNDFISTSDVALSWKGRRDCLDVRLFLFFWNCEKRPADDPDVNWTPALCFKADDL